MVTVSAPAPEKKAACQSLVKSVQLLVGTSLVMAAAEEAKTHLAVQSVLRKTCTVSPSQNIESYAGPQ